MRRKRRRGRTRHQKKAVDKTDDNIVYVMCACTDILSLAKTGRAGKEG